MKTHTLNMLPLPTEKLDGDAAIRWLREEAGDYLLFLSTGLRTKRHEVSESLGMLNIDLLTMTRACADALEGPLPVELRHAPHDEEDPERETIHLGRILSDWPYTAHHEGASLAGEASGAWFALAEELERRVERLARASRGQSRRSKLAAGYVEHVAQEHGEDVLDAMVNLPPEEFARRMRGEGTR